MNECGKSNNLDFFKALACMLIVISHCLPIAESENINFYYGQCFFRFCVPLFFIATGYFFSKMSEDKRRTYIIRIIILYVFSTMLYIPFILKFESNLLGIIKELIFGYRHLWYLVALFCGLIIFEITSRFFSKNVKYILCIILFVGGVIFDEYYKVFSFEPFGRVAYFIKYIGSTRNGVFFAFPLLTLGEFIAGKYHQFHSIKCSRCLIIEALLFLLSFMEATILKEKIGDNITLDLSLFGWTTAVPIFLIAINTNNNLNEQILRNFRKITDIVYIIHIIVFEVIVFLKLTSNGFLRALLCVLTSYILAVIINDAGRQLYRIKNSKMIS